MSFLKEIWGKRSSPSLFSLLVRSQLILLGIVLIAFLLSSFYLTYHLTVRNAESDLLAATQLLTNQLNSNVAVTDLKLPDIYEHRFGKAPRDHAYLAVWNSQGVLLHQVGNLPAFIRPVEILPPSNGPHPFVTRQSGKDLTVTIATPDGGQLLIGRPLAKEFDSIWGTVWRILVFALVIIAAAIFTSIRIARSISAPIHEMARDAQTMGANQLDSRLAPDQPTEELSVLAHAFNRVINNLADGIRRQQQFTADAAHELRTPVSIILSQSEHCLSRERAVSSYQEGFRTCLRASQHMKRLVEQLLDLSRINSTNSRQDFPLVDLSAVASEVKDFLDPIAHQKEQLIRLELAPAFLKADPIQLKQLVLNLVSNGLNYGRVGGWVNIRTYERQDAVVLIVNDNGEGIDSAHLPFIFDRFYRVDQVRTVEYGGVGLGLSLVKDIIERYGGTIQVVSTVGTGTTFEVVFPRVHQLGLQEQ
jgi:Signal transduction histidine kinase